MTLFRQFETSMRVSSLRPKLPDTCPTGVAAGALTCRRKLLAMMPKHVVKSLSRLRKPWKSQASSRCNANPPVRGHPRSPKPFGLRFISALCNPARKYPCASHYARGVQFHRGRRPLHDTGCNQMAEVSDPSFPRGRLVLERATNLYRPNH